MPKRTETPCTSGPSFRFRLSAMRGRARCGKAPQTRRRSARPTHARPSFRRKRAEVSVGKAALEKRRHVCDLIFGRASALVKQAAVYPAHTANVVCVLLTSFDLQRTWNCCAFSRVSASTLKSIVCLPSYRGGGAVGCVLLILW